MDKILLWGIAGVMTGLSKKRLPEREHTNIAGEDLRDIGVPDIDIAQGISDYQ
jgi:hypothetical protein